MSHTSLNISLFLNFSPTSLSHTHIHTLTIINTFLARSLALSLPLCLGICSTCETSHSCLHTGLALYDLDGWFCKLFDQRCEEGLTISSRRKGLWPSSTIFCQQYMLSHIVLHSKLLSALSFEVGVLHLCRKSWGMKCAFVSFLWLEAKYICGLVRSLHNALSRTDWMADCSFSRLLALFASNLDCANFQRCKVGDRTSSVPTYERQSLWPSSTICCQHKMLREVFGRVHEDGTTVS
jgi:hypothetical protein